MTVPIHGGDLSEAMALAERAGFDPGLEADWLDLSTGINANPYPVPFISTDVWTRLPGESEMEKLLIAARDYYGAPSTDHILAVPGTALAIQILPRLFQDFDPKKPAMIVGPTYADHERVWRAAGRDIVKTSRIEEADFDGISVLVNPNNPTGGICFLNGFSGMNRVWGHEKGWLIIDEAFGDVAPSASVVSAVETDNLIVLKSVGKFFGLAGMRLGFVIAPPAIITALSAMMGAWAVSGPAISVGTRALSDVTWQQETSAQLERASDQLFSLFHRENLSVGGGTKLFALLDDPSATEIFTALLSHKIYVRRFDYNENWLRFGVPGDQAAFQRLEAALSSR